MVEGAEGVLDVGFAGRLQESKGIDFIWKVAEKLGPEAGVRFHLKGAVHWQSRVEAMTRLECYSDFVALHEPGPHEEMPDFYRSLDILLQRFSNDAWIESKLALYREFVV